MTTAPFSIALVQCFINNLYSADHSRPYSVINLEQSLGFTVNPENILGEKLMMAYNILGTILPDEGLL